MVGSHISAQRLYITKHPLACQYGTAIYTWEGDPIFIRNIMIRISCVDVNKIGYFTLLSLRNHMKIFALLRAFV